MSGNALFVAVDSVVGLAFLYTARLTIGPERLFVLVGLPLLVVGTMALATALLVVVGVVDLSPVKAGT
jgi:hypothetical protein